MAGFFYILFASCVQVFHIIGLIYPLFLNKETLYKELEAEIWSRFLRNSENIFDINIIVIIRMLSCPDPAHSAPQTLAELNGLRPLKVGLP